MYFFFLITGLLYIMLNLPLKKGLFFNLKNKLNKAPQS